MSHAVVIGAMLKGLAGAMHTCMTLLLIRPFDNYTKKNICYEDAPNVMLAFVEGKARHEVIQDRAAKRCQAGAGSIYVFSHDAPVLIPIIVIQFVFTLIKLGIHCGICTALCRS